MTQWVHTYTAALRKELRAPRRDAPPKEPRSTGPNINRKATSTASFEAPTPLIETFTDNSNGATLTPTRPDFTGSLTGNYNEVSTPTSSSSHSTLPVSLPTKENYPKKPLSAWNLFFILERKRILEGHEPRWYTLDEVNQAANKARYESRKNYRSHKKAIHPNPVGFLELTRIIIATWNRLEHRQKQMFQSRAALEKDSYIKRLLDWKATQPPKPPKKRRRIKRVSPETRGVADAVVDDLTDIPSVGLWRGLCQDLILPSCTHSSHQMHNTSDAANSPCSFPQLPSNFVESDMSLPVLVHETFTLSSVFSDAVNDPEFSDVYTSAEEIVDGLLHSPGRLYTCENP